MVVAAKDTVLYPCNGEGWPTGEDNRKILWPARVAGLCEANFEVKNVGQFWNAGLAYRFPCWKEGRSPHIRSEKCKLVISVIFVRDKQPPSVIFESEALGKYTFPTSKPESSDDDPSSDVDCLSYWRLLECRRIPIQKATSNSGTSIVSLSLKKSYYPGLEIDSFWISKETIDSNVDETTLPALCAMQKKEN